MCLRCFFKNSRLSWSCRTQERTSVSLSVYSEVYIHTDCTIYGVPLNAKTWLDCRNHMRRRKPNLLTKGRRPHVTDQIVTSRAAKFCTVEKRESALDYRYHYIARSRTLNKNPALSQNHQFVEISQISYNEGSHVLVYRINVAEREDLGDVWKEFFGQIVA